MMLITFFLFFIACVFSFYIPSLVFVDVLKLKLKKGHAFIVNWVLGVCFFILLTYLLAWLNASYAIFAVLIFCLIYTLQKKIILRTISFKNIDLWAMSIILLGSLSFLSITFFSGIRTQEGLQFIKTNSTDGIVHLARISNQVIHFPPQYPGLSGVEFKGYHYFYDFLLSRFALFFHFSPFDLFFRFFPAFISLLYGGSFYLISSSITKDKITSRMILFVAYFSQSAAFILFPLYNNYEIVQGGQLVQSISLILDPSIVLGIGILLSGLFLLPKIKESWKYGLLVGLILGVLSQVKIYAGITGISCLIIYSCFAFIKYKEKYILNYLSAVLTAGILTVITYFPNNFGIGSLVFAPFLIYRQYIEQIFFTSLHWEIKRIIYEEHNNVIRIIQLYIEAFIIFWIVNLGIRIVSLFFIKKIITRQFWKNDNNIILLAMVLIPIIIPSFFIQSISVFDILQFDWIVLTLLSIPTGLVLGEIVQKKNILIKGIISLLFIIIITQNAYFVFSYLFPSGKYIISQKDTRFYEKISSIVPQKSFIATLQENDIPMVAGLTGRSTYFEKEMILFPLDDIYNERRNNLVQLKESIENCNYEEVNNQMHKINTRYLITPFISPCLAKSPAVKEYIAAENLAFYEFK